VCCSVLQSVTVFCKHENVWYDFPGEEVCRQCVALCCIVLQCVAKMRMTCVISRAKRCVDSVL